MPPVVVKFPARGPEGHRAPKSLSAGATAAGERRPTPSVREPAIPAEPGSVPCIAAIIRSGGRDGREIPVMRSTCQLRTISPVHTFTTKNTGLSGQSRLWLKFTAGEDKLHARMAFFRPLFPRWPSSGRHSRASGNDESGRDARAPRTLGSRFRGNDEGGRTACDPRTPAADLRDRRLPTDPPDDSHPPDPTERLQVAVPSLDSTSSARVSLGVARSCRMSRETSSTGRPHRQQPSPKHPTLIEGATAPPPTARQSHHPERPIINISCRSWRVAAPWILNALKKLAKFLHRDSPSVDRGAELDGFTSSWVSAKS